MAGFLTRDNAKAIDFNLFTKLIEEAMTEYSYIKSFGLQPRGIKQAQQLNMFEYNKFAQLHEKINNVIQFD